MDRDFSPPCRPPSCSACHARGNAAEYLRSSGESIHVKIEIYNQTYNVQANENEEYLKELAAYVDQKMRAVAEATQTIDSVRVAVLAALNIADELFTMRQRQTNIEGPVRARVEKCVAMVEKALEQTA
jgi:cell division protein ZapA